MSKLFAVVAALAILLTNSTCSTATGVRIKDITSVQGERFNKLFGVGLVTGLQGTGGKSPVTRQYLQNLLQRVGNRADSRLREAIRTDTQEKTDNISVVTVTAELSSFARKDGRIDVTVSALDDAESLEGGTLIITPLFGYHRTSSGKFEEKVYAVASGAVALSGYRASGEAASVQKNHPTSGRIVNGAIVEEEMPGHIGKSGCFRFLLTHPDAETARRITEAINARLPNSAMTLDAGAVEVHAPPDARDVHGFIGVIGQLRVQPDVKARVVISEKTGTVVVGENVRISQVAITHGNLTVSTTETPVVSQPAPFNRRGTTEVVPRTDILAEEENRVLHVLDETVTVGDLARALNALGVTPRDLSAIFQHLKAAGALHADLEFK
jgi:flagellar P-ring protein precursor FlgI